MGFLALLVAAFAIYRLGRLEQRLHRMDVAAREARPSTIGEPSTIAARLGAAASTSGRVVGVRGLVFPWSSYRQVPALPQAATHPAASPAPDRPARLPQPSQSPGSWPTPARPIAAKSPFDREDLALLAGGVTIAIGAIFLVRHIIENDLLGPALRVGLGYVVGFALVAASFVPRLRGVMRYRISATSVLAGAGIASLFAATIAAGLLYDFIGRGTFLGLSLGIACGALALSRREGQALAAIGLSGAWLAPIVADMDFDAVWMPLFYALLIGLAATLAVARNWRATAVFLSILTFPIATLALGGGEALALAPLSAAYVATALALAQTRHDRREIFARVAGLVMPIGLIVAGSVIQTARLHEWLGWDAGALLVPDDPRRIVGQALGLGLLPALTLVLGAMRPRTALPAALGVMAAMVVATLVERGIESAASVWLCTLVLIVAGTVVANGGLGRALGWRATFEGLPPVQDTMVTGAAFFAPLAFLALAELTFDGPSALEYGLDPLHWKSLAVGVFMLWASVQAVTMTLAATRVSTEPAR